MKIFIAFILSFSLFANEKRDECLVDMGFLVGVSYATGVFKDKFGELYIYPKDQNESFMKMYYAMNSINRTLEATRQSLMADCTNEMGDLIEKYNRLSKE